MFRAGIPQLSYLVPVTQNISSYCIHSNNMCVLTYIFLLLSSSKDLMWQMEWKSTLADPRARHELEEGIAEKERKKRLYCHLKAGNSMLCHRLIVIEAKHWLYRGTCWLRETHETTPPPQTSPPLQKISLLLVDLRPVRPFV